VPILIKKAIQGLNYLALRIDFKRYFLLLISFILGIYFASQFHGFIEAQYKVVKFSGLYKAVQLKARTEYERLDKICFDFEKPDEKVPAWLKITTIRNSTLVRKSNILVVLDEDFIFH
jgi:hypothetical protein